MKVEDRFPTFGVDISRFPKARRKIRHAYRGASSELECLIASFAADGRLAVPTSQAYCRSEGISRRALRSALGALAEGGFIEVSRGYCLREGKARVYGVTDAFRSAFNFRAPDQWPLTEGAMNRPVVVGGKSPNLNIDIPNTDKAISNRPHVYTNLISIPALSGYARLLDAADLTLSDIHQVRPHADIYRVDGLRLYAYGAHNYQNRIKKEWRRHLLIDGEPTAELDYPAMHANIILNWEELPSDAMVYETVLAGLGLRPTKTKRSAMKLAVMAALNAGDFARFRSACNDSRDGKSISRTIGRTPRQILDSMLAAYPAFSRYVCQDKELWRRLHKADSEIMLDILLALADMGVVALLLHDSVIVQARHADATGRAMAECYERRTGFPIDVR